MFVVSRDVIVCIIFQFVNGKNAVLNTDILSRCFLHLPLLRGDLGQLGVVPPCIWGSLLVKVRFSGCQRFLFAACFIDLID